MVLAEKYYYNFLITLSSKKYFLKKDLIIELQNTMSQVTANSLFENFIKDGSILVEDDQRIGTEAMPDRGGGFVESMRRYSISDIGTFALKHYQDIKNKDDIDLNLKKQTVGSFKLNRQFSKYAISIAILTAVVPFILYRCAKNDIQTTVTTIPQLQSLPEIEQKVLQNQQRILDSLTILLKLLKAGT